MASPPLNPDAFKSYIVYQIYPASFADSNGDGIGDLPGVRSKLGHIKALGADVVWLSPIYRSPQKDMGYDISDYQDIDARYGTIKDWDELLEETHRLGMKLIMDLVVNHTSDQHAWFKESRSSKSNPKRDWYMWRPPKFDAQGNRRPPNNWASTFGGSAWEWDETTQEYYLHLYVKEQPDLNWDKLEVRQAVWKLMRWWMDKGCDGFRISKVSGLPDAEVTQPEQEFQPGYKYYCNGPHVHEYLQEMHREVLSRYPNYFTVGESPQTHDPADLLPYVLPERNELQMMFHFELAKIDAALPHDHMHPLIPRIPTLPEVKSVINKWQTFMFANGGWNSLYMENHDQARSVSRLLGFGTDAEKTTFDFDVYERDLAKHWSAGAKLLAILHTTQGGTVFIYQGEEIGSTNVPRTWGIEEYKDVATNNFYNEVLEKRKQSGSREPDMSDIMDGINRKARDNARVPVQWNNSAHAGFTNGEHPWMRVNNNYKEINVKNQVDDKDSILSFWKTMIQVRRHHPVLVHGDFVLIHPEDEQIFAYTREHDGAKVLVLMNFTRDEVTATIPESFTLKGSKFIVGNLANETLIKLGARVTLRPYEGQVWALTQ